ncbi:MAG: response regulator [Planctomycetota bacterium]
MQCYLAGHDVELEFAANGREAVERALAAEFDVVLMDMQMPVLDGYAATREIREAERERGTTRPPVPIVAVTADAMTEDCERAYAAGCDLHLAKPVSRAGLLSVLRRFGSVRAATPGPGPAGVDRAAEIESLEMDELVERFVRNKVVAVGVMREAALRDDLERIEREAHKIKGTGTSFGFPELTEISARLVAAAREGDRDGARALVGELGARMAEIEAERMIRS